MDFTSPKNIRLLLEKYDTQASKGLGQNFLIDRNILNKVIESADIKPQDTILEVGPGLGTLTVELAQKAKKVIAVEKDRKMCQILKETLKDFHNIEVIEEDVLKLDTDKFETYKVVANIPYYLTSPLIRKMLETKNAPNDIVLMIQKEVAQRICSKPPKMNLLAVSVQFYADPKIFSYVSKSSFWPAPKIDSAIIKIVPRKKHEISPDLFFKVVKAGFSQPRKQLAGNLSKMLKMPKEQAESWLLQNKINPKQRAETLSIEDWISLTKTQV